ncbi:Rap1a/Tai family immunity protein [Teichococcus oryzae]|uniref:Rap1a immunity protein domain-containing protein n=1 Tax=Teichococcus oryzae TaxID=1608942 RepID=A0A5B2TL19_9PROT|nr:Rap1a/Tai family immunity protein [Pseudoroseomonas oryzae]KAA2214874.1 hypothetical protein F0Q34_04120 [Pseudoroseomonas oryzae]
MRIFPLAAALAALAAAPALAQTAPATAPGAIITHANSAGDLAALCDPAPDNPRRLESIAYCQGYMTSAGQFHAALNPPNSSRRPMFCLPSPPPTIAESGLGFAAWVRQNPQHANESPIDGLFRWAQATYPCPTGTAPRGRR